MNFQVGQKGYAKNGIEQRENVFENGCAVKTYNNVSNDLFLKGGEVVASYTRADGSKWTQSADIPGKPATTEPPVTPRPGTPSAPPVTPRPGTPTTPVPAPQPQPQPQPQPVPQKKTTPDDKVVTYGEQAANFMANRVVDTYGLIENYRYWFFTGFKRQSQMYANLGVTVESLPEFRVAFQNGANEGGSAGYNSGASEGSRAGSTMGKQAARSRFQNAVGNPAALDTASGAIPNGDGFGGLASNQADPGFASTLNEYNSAFLNEVRTAIRLGGDLEDDILADVYGRYWSLSDYYGWNDYQYATVFSSWRADNAWELFLNKKLVRQNSDPGKVQANNQMVTKYREITDANEYEDADHSRSLYRSTFTRRYERVIDDKWNNEVYGKRNNSAEARGEYYFVLALKEYARRLGYAHGYNNSFTQASRQGYAESVGPAYKNSFDQTVNQYMSNAIIENVRVELKNQAGQSTFAVFDSIFPTVLEATNFGKVAGKVSVTITGPSIAGLQATGETTMDVPGLTRVATPTKLESPAQVIQSAAANQATSVNLRIQVGNYAVSQTQNITISWAQTIRQMSLESNSSREAAYAQYLASQLAQEWKRSDGVFQGDVYAKKPLETLAGQYVQAVKALSAAEQQKLAKYASSLTAGYGKKPFLAGGKWKSVEALFKQIGYKMP